MATIKLYKSDIVPSKNMLVDNIESYLNSIPDSDKNIIEKVQYIKTDMSIGITLDINQNIFSNLSEFPYNYLSIVLKDGPISKSNKIYYYFILDFEWKSQNAVKLICNMDTVNTFRDEYINSFTDKTSIHREHENRLIKFPRASGYYRRIDPQDEGINPILYNQKITEVKDKDFDFKWYLMYRNRDNITPTDVSNPLECYICPEKDIRLSYGETLPAEIDFNQPDRNGHYYIYQSTPGYVIKFTARGVDYTVSNNNLIYCIYTQHYAQQYGFAISRGDLQADNTYKWTRVTSGFEDPIKANEIKMMQFEVGGANASSAVKDNTPPDIFTLAEIEMLPKFYCEAGKQPDKYLYKFSDIDRTDPKINKIITLPYAPIDFKMALDDTFIYPKDKLKVVELVNDRKFRANALKVIDLDINFIHTINEIDNAVNVNELKMDLPQLVPEVLDGVDKNPYYESKLYNSAFYAKEVLYDEFGYQIPLELVDLLDTHHKNIFHKIDTKFKITSTMNSNMLFDFSKLKINNTLTYPGILLARRNNEPIIYNSPYVNYVKNGYNYDKKRNDMSLGFGLASSALNIATQGISLGVPIAGAFKEFTAEKNRYHNLWGAGFESTKSFISDNPTAGILGAQFFSSTVNSLFGTISNAIQADDAMQRRLTDLKNSKINVQGSDDLDLFNYFSNNKLRVQVKQCNKLMSDSLFDLFYYCGYRHEVQAVPNMVSRRWFNFIQCEPVFNKDVSVIRENYIEDIKDRFNAGITVFHNVNGKYDFDQSKENFEVILYN